MELYLIRHAQSENNARAEADRVEDPGITPLGQRQAEQVATAVAALRPTRLLTSPFLRTLETARYVASSVGVRPEVRVDLHEQGGCYRGHLPGRMEGRPGMTGRQITERFPGFTVVPPIDEQGWWRSRPREDHDAAALRAERLLSQFAIDCADASARIACVMHADILGLVVGRLLPEAPDVPWNASLTTLQRRDDGWHVQEFNRVDHLPHELRTR